jgi:hypothetical protein
MKEYVSFDEVKNLDNKIMDAVFLFNGDSTSLYIPFLDTGSKIKIGNLDSFQVSFNNKKTHSKWIKKKVNKFSVTAEIHDMLVLYLFF